MTNVNPRDLVDVYVELVSRLQDTGYIAVFQTTDVRKREEDFALNWEVVETISVPGDHRLILVVRHKGKGYLGLFAYDRFMGGYYQVLGIGVVQE